MSERIPSLQAPPDAARAGRRAHIGAVCLSAVVATLVALGVWWPTPLGPLAPWGEGAHSLHPPAAGARVNQSRQADFGSESPSGDTRAVVEWIAASGNHEGLRFVVVDKKAAQLYVFNTHAKLVATTPVLLGEAVGDATVPGIGDRPISLVKPHERTTPAGRFVAERGRNARGEDVVWVDYDAAVSMHRVVTNVPSDRRLQRLASPSVDDNRISYGCINVPVNFYEAHIRPSFAHQRGLVYVLPDTLTIGQVFGI
jgi:hypothetical protein